MDRVNRVALTRFLAWAGLAALVLARVAVEGPHLPGAAGAIAAWGISLLPMPMAAAASFLAYRRAEGDERRFWLPLTLAVSILLLSETYWAYAVLFVDPLGPRLPHPFELLQAAAAVAFLAILVSLTRFGTEPWPVRIRFYADVVLSMVVGFVAVYRWVVGPLFEGIPRYSTGLVLVGSVYPVLGAALLIGTFGVLVGLKVDRWRSWERAVAASVTVYTLGILYWPWWYSGFQRSGASGANTLIVDAVFTGGFYLLFVAALYRLTEYDVRPVSRGVPAPVGRWPWLSPLYLSGMVLSVPLIAWAGAAAEDSADAAVYLWAVVALVSLLGVRSWLSTVEGTYLFTASVTDPVSGLANRRAFDAVLPAAVSAYDNQPVSAVAFDIDRFAILNEIAGHAEGDRVLREVAGIVQEVLDARGKVFRLGGDDLVALLPGVDAAAAADLAAECGRRVERHVRSSGMTVSLSAGVASAPRHAREGEDLVRKAMSAQEWARSAGGARTRVFDEAEGHVLDPAERLERIRRGDHLSTVRAIASTVDARDPHAPEHSRVVARAAVMLAREIGLSDERVALIETAALLHDIGKLAVDDRLLATAHALTQAEREQVEEHAVYSEQVLRSSGVDEILPWVRHHHERWDGAGYPDGLVAGQIPLEARIVAIANAYEVMTSGRPYQPALGHHAALRHIELEGGAHFDPTLAAAFVRIMWNTTPLHTAAP